MDTKEYEQAVARTANMTKPAEIIVCTFALGLAGEAGEVAELLKKHIGHDHKLDRTKLLKELGDVQWYLTALANLYGFTLEQVMQANIDKLKARYPNGWDSERSRNRSPEEG